MNSYGFMNFSIGLFVLTVLLGWAFTKLEPASGEHYRQNFAAATLSFLGILLALAMGMYFFSNPDEAGKEVFKVVTQAIIPLATLVIGYYFGQATNQKTTPK